MKLPSLHDMAVTLCEGGVIEFNGHTFRAAIADDPFTPCAGCWVDSECHGLVTDLCTECDNYSRERHYLIMDGIDRGGGINYLESL